MSDNNPPPPSSLPELGPPKADFSAPPPYELTNSNAMSVVGVPEQFSGQHLNTQSQQPQQQQHQQQQQLQQQQQPLQNHQQQSVDITHSGLQSNLSDIPLPISYHHGKLPTYEEVQMEKSLNGELPPPFLTGHTLQSPPPPPPNPLLAGLRETGAGVHRGAGTGDVPPGFTVISIDTSDAENLNGTDNSLLGTDIMFIMAFMVAFLFNWIGFLMLTCFCHTIAARYGALSGFGLSLAKWTLIVKNSTDLASNDNSWLWWLIMAFGFLICVRALIQYVSIKRTWQVLSTSAQERLLFFY